VNAEQASKGCNADADLAQRQGRLPSLGKESDTSTQWFRRGSGDSRQA